MNMRNWPDILKASKEDAIKAKAYNILEFS